MSDTSGLNDETQTVLVIDDCPDVVRLLSARLKSEGLEVFGVNSGEAGVRTAIGTKPDAILLDLEMPDMDGFEVLRLLKNNAGVMHIPTLMLSGRQGPQDKLTAFELGAVDYISKPFDMTELRVRVRSALRMASLLKLLANQAHIDGLTGLGNRARFDGCWSREVEAARRHGGPLSLALVDIDHFKSVNDTYGHPAGDQVIQHLAKLLQRECRQTDVPCRYGGEEFALIMPRTSPVDARAVCERIRIKLSEARFPRHPERTVSCSIGIAGIDADGTAVDPAHWIERADKLLYAAKEGGRDRVIVGDVQGGVTLSHAG